MFINLSTNSCVKNGVPTFNCIDVVFQNVITAALYFSGAILIIVIILVGIKYLTSRGDAKALESARTTIIYATIGMVLLFFAFAIVNFVLALISPDAAKCVLGGINGCN